MSESSEEDLHHFSKSDLGSELEKVALSVDNLENLLALQSDEYLDETFGDLKNEILDASDMQSEELIHSRSETNLNDSLDHNTSDEWENDEDNGLIVINISKDEFVEFDQLARLNLAARSKAMTPCVEQNGHARKTSSPTSLLSPPVASVPASTTPAQTEVAKDSNSAVTTSGGGNVDGPDELSPAMESVDISVDIPASADTAAASSSLPTKNIQPTPKYTPNSKPSGNPKSSSKHLSGHFGRPDILGQQTFRGVDGQRTCFFNLKIIFEPYRTGFEESKELSLPKGAIIAGRYQVSEVLGSAAFSTALQCVDLMAEEDEAQWVCLKVIKNNKDFFDQSLDEIKLLQYINSCGDPDQNHVLRLYDFFYCKEHLFIVSELLKENLYEFGRFIREHDHEPYYTFPRLKRIMHQVLSALAFIHSLNLIHCDIKPENIVIKSFSRCEVKLIDFGSSCFTSDHLTNYIQSRSYRAPEVILGLPYDHRIDVWSIAAVLAELHTGYVLFQNDSVVMMLSRITGILGPFPKRVLDEGKEVHKYFTRTDIVYERDEDNRFSMIFPKKTCLQARLHLPLTDVTPEEALFVDFIQQMLHLDPLLRLTAAEALQHPWLADAETVYFEEYVIGQPNSHSHQQHQHARASGAAPFEEQEEEDLGEEEMLDEEEEDEDAAAVLRGDVVHLDDYDDENEEAADDDEVEEEEEGEGELDEEDEVYEDAVEGGGDEESLQEGEEEQEEDSGDSEFERAAALCVDSLDEEDDSNDNSAVSRNNRDTGEGVEVEATVAVDDSLNQPSRDAENGTSTTTEEEDNNRVEEEKTQNVE